MLQNARQIYNLVKETSYEIVRNRDPDSECVKAEYKHKTMSCMWLDITEHASHTGTANMLQVLTKVDLLELRFGLLMLIQPSSWNMGKEWWAALQVNMNLEDST